MPDTRRVLVDATAIPADLGGVGRYVVEVVPELAELGPEVVVACRPGTEGWVAERAPRARTVVVPRAAASSRPARMAWEQVGLPGLVRRTRADVLFSPHYTMPLAPVPAARVVTLHDATFFSRPDVHARDKRVFFRQATSWAVRHADALVVPSAATRDEVLRYAGGDPALFHVAHHGVDASTFHPVDEAEKARVAASLGVRPGGYVAFLGTLEPRKNLPALVRGWWSAFGDATDAPDLVLAGGRGWDSELDAVVASLPDGGPRVVRPGYLPVDDLAGYLGGAAVVAYPSLGEGFGLPVLEAMACGAAVLTSRELSLPEVGGDAVAYTGTSAPEVADALRTLLADGALRSRLGTAARVRAASFTWAAAARAHVQAFDAAVARREGRAALLR